MRVRHAVLAVLAAGVAACGGGVEKEDFGERVLVALCERYERCGLYTSAEACEREWLQQDRKNRYGLGTRYDAALASGRLRYDEDAAERCVESIRDGDCRQPALSDIALLEGLEYDPACQVLRVERPGPDCQWNLECGEHGYCEYSASNACQGRCAPRAQEGETVSRSDACELGLKAFVSSRCFGPEGEEPECTEPQGTCDRPVDEGGACSEPQEDGTQRYLPCADGLWCDVAGSGLCLRKPSEGEDCDFPGTRDCEPGLVCKEGRCTRRVGEGEPCRPHDASSVFLNDECRLGLFCDADFGQSGTCRKLREGGDACRTGALECASGMRCYTGPAGDVWGTCGRRPGLGADCSSTVFIPDCAEGLLCSQTHGKCVPVARQGEPCGPLAECAFGSLCSDEGRCLPYEAASCR